MSRRSAAGSPAPLSLVKRRRRQSHGHKVSLEKIVGLTCVTSNGLSVSSETGCVTYPAGCVAVLHLPNANGRQLHILNTTKKPISAVCLSPDGKYLAIGEYGHQPSVQVWNVAGSPSHVSELKAHKYGVQCMAFSPSMKYLVSVGYQHDMHIHVWNWKSGHRVATNKITSKVYGLSFSEDGKYFVTAGNRRVRFWTMLPSGREENHTAPLKGRSAVLGDLQDNCFVAVECGRGSISSYTYVLTRTGVLCKFGHDRSLDQFVNVQARPGRSLSLCESYIICGCGEGVVRLFDPCTLDYLLTVPLPHPLGVDVALPLNPSQQNEGEKYPDTVATALDFNHKRLSVVYSDHSHYVWDVGNLRQIRKTHSSLHHSACIWDLCLYPSPPEGGVLPPSTLVTCSTDNTARFWSMDTPGLARQASSLVRNVYSKELKRVIYTSSDLSSLSDASKYPGDASAVADMQRGVRCAKFHPRGHQLALGDRAGNIRVYELQFMDVVFQVEAHDSEVLCIEYSPLSDGLQFMCSASRDRLIHVFTAGEHYQHVQTIDDHSASITALRFTVRGDLQLLSCGADKSIMFRTLQKSPGPEFQRTSHIACKSSIYDMDIDVVGKHMVTAGQDRLLRVYQLSSGKQKAVIKASTGDEGSLIKVAMDPSGLYVACSSSDKTVSLFDFYSGECLAKLYGHSEVVTQVKFSTDCRFLYSVSGDGCIFIWHLSEDLTQTMHDRLTEIGAPVTAPLQLAPIKAPPSSPLRRETYFVSKERGTPAGSEEIDSSDDGHFRLSVSQLPAWAKRHVQARPSIAQSFSTSSLEKAGVEGGRDEGGGVEGRWAERVARDPDVPLLNRTASAPDVTITVIDLTSPEKEKRNEDEDGDVFFPPPVTPAVDPRSHTSSNLTLPSLSLSLSPQWVQGHHTKEEGKEQTSGRLRS
ncbi:WD repeat-containing protein 62, partial [Geodia barretti]